MAKVELVRDRSFYKAVAMIGIPISLQQCITVGVNMLDTIMLGKLGELPLSGSALAITIFNLMHYINMGMGMGAGVLTARFWGAKDIENLKKSITIMYRLCFSAALLFTLAALLFPGAIMRLLTPEEDVIAQGVRYFRWAFPCFMLESMSLTTAIVLRTTRQVKIPLYSSIGAFFINIFCNWVFIFGKLGMPRMEIAGAALGTVISRAFEVIVICGYFLFVDKRIAYRIKDFFRPAGELLGEYLRISIPVAISDTLLGIGNTAISVIIGHLGSAFVAANSITTVTMQIATVFTAGLGQSAAIITGNTLGEGDAEKAKKQGISFALIGFAVGAAIGIVIWSIAPFVVKFYNVTEETRTIAISLMHAVAFATFFMCENSILTKGVLRGGGDTKFLMLADVGFLWAVSVPLGAAAGLLWNWPPFWIIIALRIDNVFKSVICIIRLFSDKWIKKIKTIKT